MRAAGYEHCTVFGQKTYNGVAIMSRVPVRDAVKNIVGFEDDNARLLSVTIDTPHGELRLVNGFFVNGQAPGTEKFDYKMSWLRGLRDSVRQELAHHARLMLACELAYPVILSSDGRVMDGMHRVCRALLEGLSEIEAVRFVVDPEPDFVGIVDPDALPYVDD